jgi:hypothetical protein
MATFGEPPLSDGTTPKDWPRRSLPDSLARGLAALLAIGCWLIASGKLTSSPALIGGDDRAKVSGFLLSK